MAEPFPSQSKDQPAKRFFYFGLVPSREGGLQSLLDSVAEAAERTKKMSHPSHRDRIGAVSIEWGPFYYRRTHHYYVRGIYLWHHYNNQIRVRIFKRRLYYKELFGKLWSDELMDAVVRAQPGWRGNQSLFGRGREYFLELSYHF